VDSDWRRNRMGRPRKRFEFPEGTTRKSRPSWKMCCGRSSKSQGPVSSNSGRYGVNGHATAAQAEKAPEDLGGSCRERTRQSRRPTR